MTSASLSLVEPDMEISHPALAKVVSARKHSQRLEAQVFQMSIQTEALPFSPTPLAMPFQMAPQAVADEVVEVAERSRLASVSATPLPAPPEAGGKGWSC
jgi:hypothetical protein